MFENNGHIRGQLFFKNVIFLLIWSFAAAKFIPFHYHETVFPIQMHIRPFLTLS